MFKQIRTDNMDVCKSKFHLHFHFGHTSNRGRYNRFTVYFEILRIKGEKLPYNIISGIWSLSCVQRRRKFVYASRIKGTNGTIPIILK